MGNYQLINYERKKILYDAKVLDGLQYLENSIQKLQYAHLELSSLRNIIKNIKNVHKEWTDDLLLNKSASGLPYCNLDYFSNEIPDSFALNKVTMDFFSYVHSFF